MPILFKRLLTHSLVLAGFVAVSLIYFNPVLKGKKIFQSDIMHYIAMAQQQKDFAKTSGEETYWTNSAFGGMPTYQLGAKYPHNYIKALDLKLRFLPRPADYLFLYLLSFYLLLLALKVEYRLAVLGALTFGFSTYLIIILGVGHNAKAHAIAYMPLVLTGIILTFRKKYNLGFLLTTIALGLEFVANHFQMTYYLLLLIIILGIAYLIDAYKKQQLPHFFKSVGLLTIAAIIAVGLNATNIMATQEYAKESTRGKSELTIDNDGSPKALTNGLSKAYITEYSYGILESFNLFIPKFMGGGNREDIGRDSETYKTYINAGASPIDALNASKNAPMYWGDQTIVEAPAYVGAVILFLFILGLFLVKGRLKWWLVGGTLVSWLLSLGKNWFFVSNVKPNSNPITNFFIDYIPLYDKFRAVSSIQVILELCIPILGIFALVRLFNNLENHKQKLKALKYTLIITAGLCLLFLVFKSTFFNFESFRDKNLPELLVDAFVKDRISLFTTDTIRTLILVLLSAGILYLFLNQKLSKKRTIVLFAVLLVFDLVSIDRQYVNNDDFVPALQVNKPYRPNTADNTILKDKDHFRVLDIHSANTRATSQKAQQSISGITSTSYYHNSLTGYHAAKLKRYDELLDFHIYKNNVKVLNMLNTKYIIDEDEKGKAVALQHYTQPNGNAWFVKALWQLPSANEEIKALDTLDTKINAVTTQNFGKLYKAYEIDSIPSIALKVIKPNYLKYESNNLNDGLAVFSEVYYKHGWNAYIDGNLVSHIRVNYVLRALEIAKGNHIIEFKFEPKVVKTGSTIALASSILLVLLIMGGLFFEFKRQ